MNKKLFALILTSSVLSLYGCADSVEKANQNIPCGDNFTSSCKDIYQVICINGFESYIQCQNGCDYMTGKCANEPMTGSPCMITGCPVNFTCNTGTGACDPVQTQQSCVQTGCMGGQTCNQQTGLCETHQSGQLCTPGTKECRNGQKAVCLNDGSWELTDCSITNQICQSGECVTDSGQTRNSDIMTLNQELRTKCPFDLTSRDCKTDNEYTVTGRVTAISGKNIWIQDPNATSYAGMVVFVGANPPVYSDSTPIAVNDDVTLSATGTLYFGMYEMNKPSSLTKVSSNNTPIQPVTVSGTDIDPYQNMLVKFDNVSLSEEVQGKKSTGALVDNDFTYKFTTVGANDLHLDDHLYTPNPAFSVGQSYTSATGIIIVNNNWYRLAPRDASDLVVSNIPLELSNVSASATTAQTGESITITITMNKAADAATPLTVNCTGVTCPTVSVDANASRATFNVTMESSDITVNVTYGSVTKTVNIAYSEEPSLVAFNKALRAKCPFNLADNKCKTDDEYTVTGRVTAISGKTIWIQDPEATSLGGMYVYTGKNPPVYSDSTQTQIAVNDDITVSAKGALFYGWYEMTSPSSLTKISSNNTPVQPVTVSGSDIDVYQNMLVKYDNVSLTEKVQGKYSNGNTVDNDYTYKFTTVGSNNLHLDDYIYTPTPNFAVDQNYTSATGIILVSNNWYRLAPRNASDLVSSGTVPPALTLTDVTASKDSAETGDTITITVTMNQAATTATDLTVNCTGVDNCPSVSVAANAATATFDVTMATSDITVEVVYGDVTKSVTIEYDDGQGGGDGDHSINFEAYTLTNGYYSTETVSIEGNITLSYEGQVNDTGNNLLKSSIVLTGSTTNDSGAEKHNHITISGISGVGTITINYISYTEKKSKTSDEYKEGTLIVNTIGQTTQTQTLTHQRTAATLDNTQLETKTFTFEDTSATSFVIHPEYVENNKNNATNRIAIVSISWTSNN